MMLRKVLKRIPKGRGEYLESGTIVEVSGFRNVKVLEASRFLGPVTEAEAKAWSQASKPAPAPKAADPEVEAPKPKAAPKAPKRVTTPVEE